MGINISQLTAFYMAAKLGGITMAAEKLMVTPPAVSMQIKHLEKTVGLPLMYRQRNAIRLTEVGKKVYEKSKEIFHRLEELESYLENLASARCGELYIGGHQTTAKYIMPDLMRKFNESYPNINIKLTTGPTSALASHLVEQDIELALMVRKPENPGISYRKVGNADVLLISAANSALVPENEISVARLSALPLILREKHTASRDVVDQFLAGHDVTPNIVMELGSHHLIKEFVQKDIGLGFLERFALHEELDKNALKIVTLTEGAPQIEYWICHLNRRYLSPPALAFLGMLEHVDCLLPNASKESCT